MVEDWNLTAVHLGSAIIPLSMATSDLVFTYSAWELIEEEGHSSGQQSFLYPHLPLFISPGRIYLPLLTVPLCPVLRLVYKVHFKYLEVGT